MLKILRNKKTAKKVFIGLAIIIVPAFTLWGAGSVMRNKSKTPYIGKIFGENIRAEQFKESLEAVKNAAIIQFGDKLPEVKDRINFQAQAWERLILMHEANRRGIRATDKEVVDLIARYPFFQRNNVFDPKTYRELLQYVFRTQPRVFEEQTRQDIILTRLYTQVTDGLKVDDSDVHAEYEKSYEEVSIYFAAALPAEFAKNINPTDEQLRGYFGANTINFKQPLSFNTAYVATDSEEKIRSFNETLKKKQDFAQAASAINESVKETGFFSQLDPIPGIGWTPDVIALIGNMKIGAYTSPLAIDKKYYIFMLKDRREPHIPEFDTIKDKIKEAYVKEESERVAKAKAQECLASLKKENETSLNLNKVAQALGMKYAATVPFKFGSYIEGIGASDDLWTEAHTLKENTPSPIIKTSSGFYIIMLKSRTPIDEKKFESEKAEFAKTILLRKKQDYFTKFTEELKRKAQ